MRANRNKERAENSQTQNTQSQKLHVVLLRHGLAGDPNIFMKLKRGPDSRRPLTEQGERELKIVVRALKKIFSSCDLIATSPFLRAAQTAKVLSKKLKTVQTETWFELQPDIEPNLTLAKLRSLRKFKNIVLVGHEPHLSRFLSFILTGGTQTNFHIKKGGFALVEFEPHSQLTRARLKCLVQPSQLKKITKL